MSTENRKYDVRTLERHLDKGLISREEYKEYLEELADVADKSVAIEAKFEEGVLEEEE